MEDNPVNQRVTVAMLENLGFCVDVVDNGVEAVITATMVPYRAILMDCQIPVLNGFETTREIRSQYGRVALLPHHRRHLVVRGTRSPALSGRRHERPSL